MDPILSLHTQEQLAADDEGMEAAEQPFQESHADLFALMQSTEARLRELEEDDIGPDVRELEVLSAQALDAHARAEYAKVQQLAREEQEVLQRKMALGILKDD